MRFADRVTGGVATDACWSGGTMVSEVPCDLAAPAGREWPGGHFLSFASPKERKQRKGEPAVCVRQQSCGQPAVLASAGVSLELGYRLKQSRALIRLKLRSSAQTEGPGTAQPTRLVARYVTLQSNGNVATYAARAKRSAARIPAVEAGLSSAAAGGKRAGDCLSEASLSQTLAAASSARHRAAARPSARLFFGYLLLAKQKKVTRPPGRNPASRRRTASTRQQSPPCPSGQKQARTSHQHSREN